MCVSGARVDVVQVALMGVVSSAVAAMDTHRGVAAAVAEHGLAFLRNLSLAEANKVSARWCSMGDGQGEGLCVREGGWARVCGMVGGLRA